MSYMPELGGQLPPLPAVPYAYGLNAVRGCIGCKHDRLFPVDMHEMCVVREHLLDLKAASLLDDVNIVEEAHKVKRQKVGRSQSRCLVGRPTQ